MENKDKSKTSLIPIGANGLARVGNAIAITNKLLLREYEVESFFNKAYYLLYCKIIENTKDNFYDFFLKDENYINKSYDYYLHSALLTEAKSAIILLNNIITSKPYFYYAYYFRAIAYESLGASDLAIKDYSKCIELSPNNIFGYNKRALWYSIVGKFNDAINDCEKALKINKHINLTYATLALVYYSSPNLKLAIDYCTKAITINPYEHKLYGLRADIYSKEKNYLKAISDLDKSIDLKPMDRYLSRRGYLYSLINNHYKAIADCTHAIEIFSDDETWKLCLIYKTRASAKIAIGDHDGANQDMMQYEIYKKQCPGA